MFISISPYITNCHKKTKRALESRLLQTRLLSSTSILRLSISIVDVSIRYQYQYSISLSELVDINVNVNVNVGISTTTTISTNKTINIVINIAPAATLRVYQVCRPAKIKSWAKPVLFGLEDDFSNNKKKQGANESNQNNRRYKKTTKTLNATKNARR